MVREKGKTTRSRRAAHRSAQKPPLSAARKSPRHAAHTPSAARTAFDQSREPVRRRREARTDGMQQIILPLGGPVPDAAPARPTPEQRTRRVTRGEQRRRRRNRRLIVILLLLIVIGVGSLLSVNLLFKVEGYSLRNLDQSQPADLGIYSEDAVLAALNVAQGDNLFGFSASEKAAAMAKALPYMETVLVSRRLPSTVVVRVAPAVESYCAATEGGWYLLSEKLKVLAFVQEQPQLPLLTVPLIAAPQVGERLSVGTLPAPAAESSAEKEQSDSQPQETAAPDYSAQADLQNLLTLLERENLLDRLTSADLSDLSEIVFVYQNRITVRLGTANNLDYKLRMAGYILRNEKGDALSDTDKGTLDVSHQQEDGSIQAVFTPA